MSQSNNSPVNTKISSNQSGPINKTFLYRLEMKSLCRTTPATDHSLLRLSG